ncbi:DUF2203 domain-containing protein [Halalkalibacter nanhaiisediminis]|uniref:Cell division protein DivIVA n=1 Tax=Halalkalibacter nanhaiisediminis TaxID=688079 RepID=A0A562QSR2_9BACI|nr:DUF2203 domain-containing protein [Halalkalibacter nanhaiisediminis]TWI59126.1 hypothetical protein IQ10_00838 [Halalkalibacter nanhaiisediminis]
MSKIYFTLEEANELLPTLEKELAELQQLRKEFQYKSKQLKKIKESTFHHLQTETDSVFMKESELEFLEIQAQLHVYNIEASGAQLKNIEMGLLDFPAIIQGEEVLLCWKQGESEITHFHGEDEGYTGRKPIDE